MVDKKIIVQAIIEKVESDYDDVEILTDILEGYDHPGQIIIKGEKKIGYVPDVVLKKKKTTDLYEVELGRKDDYELDKWKLFSLYSHKQHGNFNIVIPEDNLTHLRKILKENQISAKILYFS